MLRALLSELSPVEDILYDHEIVVGHNSIGFWVERFGLEFAGEIRRKQKGFQLIGDGNMDEAFVRKPKNIADTLKFIKETMRK